MQQRVGVAARLRQPFEHQLGRCLVGRALEVAHLRGVQLVAGVLLVHLGGHALEGFFHLRFGDQPTTHERRKLSNS